MTRLLLTAAVVLALGAPAAHAGSAGGERQHVTAAFTTARPNTPTGVTVTATYSDGGSGKGLPHALRRVSDGLPQGTVVRSQQIPKCTANDLILMVAGPAACPKGSVVGTGSVLIDFGIGALGRLKTTVSLINTGPEILFLGREPNTGIGLVDHGMLRGSAIEVTIPNLPGASAEGAAVDMESFTITKASGLLVSPPACPVSGHWTFLRGHTYGDGVTQNAAAPIPCVRSRHANKRVHRRPHRKHRARGGAGVRNSGG